MEAEATPWAEELWRIDIRNVPGLMRQFIALVGKWLFGCRFFGSIALQGQLQGDWRFLLRPTTLPLR
jgi:hypothetical protein